MLSKGDKPQVWRSSRAATWEGQQRALSEEQALWEVVQWAWEMHAYHEPIPANVAVQGPHFLRTPSCQTTRLSNVANQQSQTCNLQTYSLPIMLNITYNKTMPPSRPTEKDCADLVAKVKASDSASKNVSGPSGSSSKEGLPSSGSKAGPSGSSSKSKGAELPTEVPKAEAAAAELPKAAPAEPKPKRGGRGRGRGRK